MTATPANGHSTVTGAALALTDEDALPTALLVLAPASIPETGGVSTVTAVLTARATTLTVSAAAGTGASAGDFTLSGTTTLTVAAGATTSTGVVTVAAVRDPDVSGDKRVTMSAAAVGGLGVADPRDETLVIRDISYGLVLDPAVGLQVTEGGGTATGLIGPGARGRGETDVPVRPPRRPCPDGGGPAGGVVVRDDVDVRALGDAGSDPLREAREPLGPMARLRHLPMTKSGAANGGVVPLRP